MELIDLIINDDEYEDYKKDINNYCLNINTYLRCIGCNGYSSSILCPYYESNETLRELEYIKEKKEK